MDIKALAPWYGSKRLLAPTIAWQLGDWHDTFIEPFCGSMSVLLAKPPVANEIVNDLHGDLINLALVVRHPLWGPWLYRQLRRTMLAEEIHRAACRELVEQCPNPTQSDAIGMASARRAYWYFTSCWMGRSGVAGTVGVGKTFAVRYCRGGGLSTRWDSAVGSIPAWRRRLRSVSILNRDGFELLESADDRPQVAIYCDPPYLQKSASYQHDFADPDHERLAERLRRFARARVVVSYYAHPRLDILYPGWTVMDVAMPKKLSVTQTRERPAGVAPEVLLINGPVRSAEQPSLFDRPDRW